MAFVTGPWTLFLALVLIRGFGQGALSVVSMTLVGKWFSRRLGLAMGLYTVLMTIGFIGTVLGMGEAVKLAGWRAAWNGIGISLLAFAPVAWLLARDTPASCGLADDEAPANPESASTVDIPRSRDFTLLEALRSPVFWIFSLGTASFNLVWSSITLFNESILKERGFDETIAVEIMAILTGCGLVSNLIAGKLATRNRLGPLLGIGLAVLAVALAAFPRISTAGEARLYAVAMGLTGGIVMVVFFAAWRHLFGPAHLGQIQGVAQIVSTLASASGPLLMAECQRITGSYSPMFYGLAGGVGLLAVVSLFARPPEPSGSLAYVPLAPALEALKE
jgi:cyanate permease